MFFLLLRKELKVFFSNKGNLVFMVFLPIVLVTIMSFSLESYMDADYGTFENGKVYYYLNEPSDEALERFWNITDFIQDAVEIQVEETMDYEQAAAEVEASGAYGVITISGTSLEYYRSPFNEPEGGKVVRGLYEQLIHGSSIEEQVNVQTVELPGESGNSKVYFTFSGLAFSILFMALLVAHSVYDERDLGTIQRIRLSKAGVGQMFAGKIAAGIVCGIGQTVVVLLFSGMVFGVRWGEQMPLMLLLLLLLILYSAVFGAVLGMVSKNKSMCQSTVMMITMLCGYLGGAITPVYLLENMSFFNIIIKVSPLYWVNRAMSNLYNGIVNETVFYSAAVLMGLSAAILLLYFGLSRRKGGAI